MQGNYLMTEEDWDSVEVKEINADIVNFLFNKSELLLRRIIDIEFTKRFHLDSIGDWKTNLWFIVH